MNRDNIVSAIAEHTYYTRVANNNEIRLNIKMCNPM